MTTTVISPPVPPLPMSLVTQRLRDFSNLPLLKRAVLTVYAHLAGFGNGADSTSRIGLKTTRSAALRPNVMHSNLVRARETFRVLDSDGSGVITRQNYLEGLRRERRERGERSPRLKTELENNSFNLVGLGGFKETQGYEDHLDVFEDLAMGSAARLSSGRHRPDSFGGGALNFTEFLAAVGLFTDWVEGEEEAARVFKEWLDGDDSAAVSAGASGRIDAKHWRAVFSVLDTWNKGKLYLADLEQIFSLQS